MAKRENSKEVVSENLKSWFYSAGSGCESRASHMLTMDPTTEPCPQYLKKKPKNKFKGGMATVLLRYKRG